MKKKARIILGLLFACGLCLSIFSGKASANEKELRTTYPVTVNYGRSVEDMVAAGHYDWINPDFTSDNFPTERTGTAKITIVLVNFDQDISLKEVFRKLDQMGLRPAELRELLALGEQYPDAQRKFHLVALGSVWEDQGHDYYFPFLLEHESKRCLDMYWSGYEWISPFQCVAVRK